MPYMSSVNPARPLRKSAPILTSPPTNGKISFMQWTPPFQMSWPYSVIKPVRSGRKNSKVCFSLSYFSFLIHSPGDNIAPFRLRRPVVKLTTQHRYIHVLLHFAHFPRLRPAFLKPLPVLAVPTPPRVSISLPSTPLHWQSLIEAVCNSHIMTSGKWLTDEVMKLYAHFPGGRYYRVVHCECALIAHFETTQPDPPPFSYIGVSKLSCRACQAWIQAFNTAGGQYHTREMVFPVGDASKGGRDDVTEPRREHSQGKVYKVLDVGGEVVFGK